MVCGTGMEHRARGFDQTRPAKTLGANLGHRSAPPSATSRRRWTPPSARHSPRRPAWRRRRGLRALAKRSTVYKRVVAQRAPQSAARSAQAARRMIKDPDAREDTVRRALTMRDRPLQILMHTCLPAFVSRAAHTRRFSYARMQYTGPGALSATAMCGARVTTVTSMMRHCRARGPLGLNFISAASRLHERQADSRPPANSPRARRQKHLDLHVLVDGAAYPAPLQSPPGSPAAQGLR